MEDTIVSLRFTDVDRALRALYEFRQLDRDRRPRVRGAVLVQRSPQGAIDVPQPDPHGDGQYLPPGGIVGMLLDVLRGPLGILFARPTDEFGGDSGHPAHEAEREIALDQIRRSLEPGSSSSPRSPTLSRTRSTRRSARWAEMSLAALPARSTPRSVGPTRRRRPSCPDHGSQGGASGPQRLRASRSWPQCSRAFSAMRKPPMRATTAACKSAAGRPSPRTRAAANPYDAVRGTPDRKQ